MSVRSHWDRLPYTREVHCEACDETHTLYRVAWITHDESPVIRGWPPWAAAKYGGWCPEHGRIGDYVDRQGHFPPPSE